MDSSPSKYALQSYLTELGISWIPISCDQDSYQYFPPYITMKPNVLFTILTPSRFQQARVSYDEFWTELKEISSTFQSVIIGMDFLEYVELIQGRKKQTIKEITEISSDFDNVLVLPLDSIKDLRYVVIPIIQNQVNEQI